MLNLLLMAMERILYAVIFGGGIILAACVRPLFLQVLTKSDQPVLISAVEGMSIRAWNRYNRYAFIATAVLLSLDVIRILVGLESSAWHLGCEFFILLLFLRKFSVDKKLKRRFHELGDAAVGSPEQSALHRQVEWLSKVILAAALVLAVLPW